MTGVVTGVVINRVLSAAIVLPLLLSTSPAQGHGIRDRTRVNDLQNDTRISASQANELTLTLVNVEPQVLQTWVRTAASLDESGKILRVSVCSPEAANVKVGQRVRAFPPDSKSSVYQARISSVFTEFDTDGCRFIEATLARKTYQRSAFYVMEIIVSRGEFLAIPSEAIIDEGNRHVVYVAMTSQDASGDKPDDKASASYQPREIQTGLQGELYTEVLHGLSEGERVVTLGSFFIDADYKLKSASQMKGSHAHHHH